MAATLDVNAHAYFLPRKDLYDSVKPYILEDTSDSVPRSNSHSERVDDILFRDLRGKEADLSFAKAGFGVLHHNTSLSYDDFFDPKLVYGVYCREIASCLLQYTGGCHVQIFDVNTRARHAQFTALTRSEHDAMPPKNFKLNTPEYGKRRRIDFDASKDDFIKYTANSSPALMAHCDFSHETIQGFVSVLNEERDGSTSALPYIQVNVWHPLKGPVQDYPLALCDASTVDPNDLRASDIVSKEREPSELMLPHYSSQQAWYYLSNQMPNELFVFRQGGSQSDGRVVPHVSFQHPDMHLHADAYRESIEVRAMIYFDQ